MTGRKQISKGKKMSHETLLNAEEMSIFDQISKVKNSSVKEQKKRSRSVTVHGDERELDKWTDISAPSKRNWHSLKDDMSKWTNKDYLIYFKKKYYDKYNINYSVNLAAGCLVMAGVQEKISSLIQKDVTPHIMKQYIDWFYENMIDMLLNKYSCMKLVWLSNDININAFMTVLTATIGVEQAPQLENEDIKNETIYTFQAMADTLISDSVQFVQQYGVILPIAYLVHCKKMQKKSAIDFIKKTIINCIKKNVKNFDIIKSSTEILNKYPTSCNFAEMQSFLEELSLQTGCDFCSLKIEFSNRSKKLSFLKES